MPKIPFLITCVLLAGAAFAGSLEEGFKNPPQQAGIRCWWWWLNGNVTKEAITKDLQAMHDKNFSGALIFDAGGADQRGNRQVPAGPVFASKEWIDLFKHAISEAKRLELELGVSIQKARNLGKEIKSLTATIPLNFLLLLQNATFYRLSHDC